MKKVISVCIALMLLLACVPLHAFADDMPVFAVGNVEARPGETVEVPVLIENNPGIVALDVSVSFDASVLTLQNAVQTDLFDAGAFTFGGSYATSAFTIIWENGTGSNVTASGAFATLTFLVSEEAPIGETTISISYIASSVFDVNLTEVQFELRSGSVAIVPEEVGGWSFSEDCTLCTYEGLNGEKYVTGIDVIYPVISDYVLTTGGWTFDVELNEYNMESTGAKLVIYDESGSIVEEYYSVMFGDVNGDGVIDGSDSTLVMYAIGYALNEPWTDFIYSDDFPQSFAADANHDLIIDGNDLSCIEYEIGSVEPIDQVIA